MIRTARGRRQAVALGALAVLLVPTLVAVAAPGPAMLGPIVAPPSAAPGAHLALLTGTTSRVSVNSAEVQASGASAEARISADGRFVAFTSAAPDLSAEVANNAAEVFVRDLQAGTTERLLIVGGRFAAQGGQADQPSISASGEFVAFRYRGPGTSDGEPNTRVFLWQRGKGAVEVAATGNQPSFARREPSIAPDGLWVAFSAAPPAGTIALPRQVYAWNRQTGQIVVVSSTQAGGGGNGASARPSAGNGGWFAFDSAATNLVGQDNNPGGLDVFVKNINTGAVTLLTPRPAPTAGIGTPVEHSDEPVIAADGGFVAFSSVARLSAQDTNTTPDVYRWNRAANQVELVSINASGNAAAGSSVGPAISGDGRYVAFASAAATIIAPSSPGGPLQPPAFVPAASVQGPTEIYLRDMNAPDSIRVSVTTDNVGAGAALRASVANDGSRVTFDTAAANLVAGDTNRAPDVFLRELPPVPSAIPNPLDFGGQAVGLDSFPAAVIVGNDGWADMRISGITIAGANPGDFRIVADPCSGNPIGRGLKCPVTIAYKPTAAGTRTAELRIAHNVAGSPRVVRLRGTATDARLSLDADVGELGRVVIATGSGFPANAPVKLRWLPGITPRLPPVVADAKGSFKIQVLVFYRDVLGPRILRAEPASGSCFPAVDARYLVVQVSGQPGGFPGSVLNRDPISRPAGDAPAGSFALPSQVPCVPGSGPVAPVITAPPIYTPPPAPLASPTPSPTPTPRPSPRPGPTPTPTPIPDTRGPDVVKDSGTPGTVYVCSAPRQMTFNASASDSSGVRFMRLYYNPPGATLGSTYQLMTLYSGTIYNGSWSLTIGTDQAWATGTMHWYVEAYDWPGNKGWSLYQKTIDIVHDDCIR